ncbi:hypothetical protein SNEBB_005208 [Seison nebaliae]|nr:hypothetical protein SNEBB_005208 [Seison nebaliae]
MLKPYIFFLLVVLNIDCLPQLTPVPDEYVYYREVRAQLYPIFKPNQQEKEYIKKMIKHIPKELQLFFDSIEYRRQDYINHATKFFQDTTPNIIYEPTNPTESPLCTQSKNLSSGEHNGYVRSEVIDQGNLTFSYKLKKRNGEKEKEKMVLKVLGLAGDFIMHSNAYYALNHILPEIKFYGVMKSIRDPSYRFLKEPPIYDSLSCYCVITEFIDGKSLDDKMLRVVSKWSLKQKLRLIITLMKQLQALQFSYNNYNIFPNKEYGERHTMTLHHGNVRPSNIILANSNNEARFWIYSCVSLQSG